MPVGTVAGFDPHRGRGEVDADGHRFGFHSTRIADGSRSIVVGSTVRFAIAPGPCGRWEAVDLECLERR